MSEPPAGYGAAYGPPPGPYGLPYATWIQRVGGYIVDTVLVIPGYILVLVGSTLQNGTGGVSSTGVMLVLIGSALMLGIVIWNTLIRQGRTGWSVGKQVAGIRLLSERTGEPVGAWPALARQIAHVLDSLPCYLGYLWPLWDPKRQTYADKLMSTVVVVQPRPQNHQVFP
jgi:uncharacterized RDD family membrane protein YckC